MVGKGENMMKKRAYRIWVCDRGDDGVVEWERERLLENGQGAGLLLKIIRLIGILERRTMGLVVDQQKVYEQIRREAP